jgi:ubiquinone biosynthesis protein UbiJ
MLHDPNDPALQRWLRSLKPRSELAARYALRAKFLSLRGDAAFSVRIAELLQSLKPDEAELGAILADARRVGEAFDGRRRTSPQRKRRQSS